MAKPAFFTLTKSDLNTFLLAPIGRERNGMTLSIISGFARLDLDPWAEAERLAGLPPVEAIEALAYAIARMSGGWLPPEARSIAERLVPLLPNVASGTRPGKTSSGQPALSLLQPPSWLFWLLLAALAIAGLMNVVL